jgi:hypothetical protein
MSEWSEVLICSWVSMTPTDEYMVRIDRVALAITPTASVIQVFSDGRPDLSYVRSLA